MNKMCTLALLIKGAGLYCSTVQHLKKEGITLELIFKVVNTEVEMAFLPLIFLE